VKDETLLIPVHHPVRPWAMRAGVTPTYHSNDQHRVYLTSVR
jgi:peptide/nickel transport system substrate-binding protein